jgi:hypothetical protein
MALGRKGARRIVVDGTAYRWRLRRRPTYLQGLAFSQECGETDSGSGTAADHVVTDASGLRGVMSWLMVPPR